MRKREERTTLMTMEKFFSQDFYSTSTWVGGLVGWLHGNGLISQNFLSFTKRKGFGLVPWSVILVVLRRVRWSSIKTLYPHTVLYCMCMLMMIHTRMRLFPPLKVYRPPHPSLPFPTLLSFFCLVARDRGLFNLSRLLPFKTKIHTHTHRRAK